MGSKTPTFGVMVIKNQQVVVARPQTAKMLDSRAADSQGGGSPSKPPLTAKPVLT